MQKVKATTVLCSLMVGLFIFTLILEDRAEAIRYRKPRALRLIVGKSLVIDTDWDINRISVASDKIAFVKELPPRSVYVLGVSPGVTNLTLWNEEDFVTYDVEVVYDISQIKRKLYEMLPEEKGIRVFANQNGITLTGSVSSATNLTEALAIAQMFAPGKGTVSNLLEVKGGQQVMLEVKVAEMSKSLLNRLGINFSWIGANGFGVGMMGGLVSASGGVGALNLDVSPQVSGLLSFQSGSDQWSGFLDVLRSNGLLKILAEPTLIAISGQEAEFLAGGEFPVPVPDQDGIAIQFKKFGVGLRFTPTVMDKDRISINVRPEVSELDYSAGVSIGGSPVPGLSTRYASTTVELGDGQSFAIAGLLRENARETINKYPVLGDIPILGALFKSQEFQKNETELVIIVTPHLAKPLDKAKQTLPTDFYIEPDDAEFFVWGIFGKSADKGVKMDGKFGHIYNE